MSVCGKIHSYISYFYFLLYSPQSKLITQAGAHRVTLAHDLRQFLLCISLESVSHSVQGAHIVPNARHIGHHFVHLAKELLMPLDIRHNYKIVSLNVFNESVNYY